MIVDERLVTYINSLDTGNTEILDEIEREALETYVPIVRKEMQSFLKLILSIKRPAPQLRIMKKEFPLQNKILCGQEKKNRSPS